MMDWLRALFGASTMMASHPGRVRASVWRVVQSYPLWPSVLAGAWLVSLLAVLDGFDWAAFLLLGLATYGNYLYWASIRPWFDRGDVCPAVVVSEKPLLVATLTDLAADDVPYPAVKIRREPVSRFEGNAGKFGKPVVCVARYDGTPGAACWTNFHPRPVQCATDDDAEVKRLLREIDAERWNELKAAVNRLPKPFKPGLYRLTNDA